MRKSILIGLDGCSFNVLDLLISDGKLPTLSEITSSGARAILKSTIPPNSLPAWTSIFTGVNPGKHGIIDSPLRIDDQVKVITSRDRAVGTLWDVLSAFNIRQIIVNEPVTYPPEKVNGIMLTGFSTPPSSQNYIYPTELKEEVDKVSGGYMPDLEPDFESTIRKNRGRGLEIINDFAKKTFKVANHLAKNYEWDLLVCIFTSIDRLNHFYFNDLNAISSHYKLLDCMIAKIINQTDANVLIVSDHGFGPLKKCFYINSWLKKLNYLKERRALSTKVLLGLGLRYRRLAALLSKARMYGLIARLTPRSIKLAIPTNGSEPSIDYRNSVFYSLSVNGGIYVRDIGIETSALINYLIRTLRSLTIDGERPIESVFRRQDVLWGECIDRAPEIMFLPSAGYEVSPRICTSILESPNMFGDIRTGAHRPEGIFLAFGPDIRKGRLKCIVQTWDIAPTILHGLGLAIPSYMDGRVLKEIFKKGSEPSSRPAKIVKWYTRWEIRERVKRVKLRKGKS